MDDILMENEHREVPMQTPKQFLLQVPVPAQTSTYKPVSHGKLMQLVTNAIRECGFILKGEIYTHSKDGQVANGKYLLEYGDDPDMSLMVAWQNSYNKKVTFKLAVGAWVFICENGMCDGDVGSYKSKHVGDIQEVTPEIIREYINDAASSFDRMVKDKETMKGIIITPKESAEILGRMFILEENITSTQLNVIKREIHKPTYDYRSPGTVWELYNHVTFALKDCHPRYWLEQQQNVHKFFVEEFKI